jgi:hypothetical protein
MLLTETDELLAALLRCCGELTAIAASALVEGALPSGRRVALSVAAGELEATLDVLAAPPGGSLPVVLPAVRDARRDARLQERESSR